MRVRDRIALAIGGAALLTSVLAVGGVLRWTQAIVAGLVALALGSQTFARRQLDGWSPLVVLLGITCALTAIQLIPFPSGILETLAPVGSTLRDDGAVIAGTDPWRAISLDPAHTLGSLAFFLTLLGVALIAIRFAASERGRYLLLAGVAVTAGLAAMVAAVHTLIGADALYGLYEPQRIRDAPVFGPLLSPNHFGGLMAMGALVAIGLAFYHKQTTHMRVMWICIAIGCVILLGISLSRGAMVGFALGALVLGGVMLASRSGALTQDRHRRRSSALRTDVLVGIVVVVGLGIALYMTAGNVVSQLDNTSVIELDAPHSKYAAWRSSLDLVRESPWVGIGRGGVETVLSRVNPGSSHFTYSHLENEYLSAVVEYGIPGAILLALAFGWCVLVAFRRRRDGALAAAALGGLAMIVFQSAVDYGVELLGVAVPATILASTVLLVPLRATDDSTVKLVGRRSLLVVLLVGAVIVLLLPATRTVREDHDLIAEHPQSVETMKAAIERHPLDYLPFGNAATVIERTEGAVPYLNHAMRLHPTHPGLHRLAGRMLVRIGRPDQAAVEYALAMRAEPQPRQLLAEIVHMLPNPDHAAAALPLDYPNFDGMLRSLADIKRQDIAQRWLARIAAQPQHDLRVVDLLYKMAMERADTDAALAAAELRLRVARTTTSRVMLARARFARKEYDKLLVELADVTSWSGRIDEKAQGWLVLCDVHKERRDWDNALKCLHRLDASGLPIGRGEVARRLGAINEERTRESKKAAIEAMEKALNEPTPKPTP